MGRKIVVIDDHHDAATSFARYVTALGGEPYIALDAEAGIELVRKERPAVVFVDIAMPVIDGYEVCRRLRAELGGAVQLVAMTGWGRDDDKQRSIEAGFDAHITKPPDPKVVRRFVTGS